MKSFRDWMIATTAMDPCTFNPKIWLAGIDLVQLLIS